MWLAGPGIQSSMRLDATMWAALNDLAVRERVENGRRLTVHDLLMEGGGPIRALHDSELSR